MHFGIDTMWVMQNNILLVFLRIRTGKNVYQILILIGKAEDVCGEQFFVSLFLNHDNDMVPEMIVTKKSCGSRVLKSDSYRWF